MGNYSYTQSDFRGGQWDKDAQGRTTDERWKTALQINLNAWSLEGGAWSRRPGFRYVCNTRRGAAAKLLPFRFGRDAAYQGVFTSSRPATGPIIPDTDNRLRFVVGLGLLMDEANQPGVLSIEHFDTVGYGQDYGNEYGGTTEHTTVALTSVPSTWAVFDTVMFQPADYPGSFETFGRQFEIGSISTALNTINIIDPITRDPPVFDDFVLRDPLDSMKRVLEFNTPYGADDIQTIRVVQAIDNILFLHSGYFPRVLKESGLTQFTLGTADFHDGPYFDTNDTATTLTPSAATGSITLTASSAVGINDGDGFIFSDVGRLIRFQCGPPQWGNATVYKKNAKVIGSDDNIYRAVKTGSGHDPTSDDGTYWEISPDTVFWTWLKITAITTNLIVTATVMGDDLQIKSSGGLFSGHQTTLAATTAWRLGVYSDTTGYPTCGTYWEGRLFLAGAVANRVDTTKSFGTPDTTHTYFDFAPTYKDGTVADDSALSFTLNSKDVNPVLWMIGGDAGLSIGSASAEWLIKASQLDDPLTPFDTQARPITTTGCADIEPVQAWGNAVFVQARQRKLIVNRTVPGGRVEPQNISFYTGGLMAPSITDIAWAQEPALELAALKSDGTLIGASYRLSLVEESYIGWHTYEHGAGRSFEAISYGPNFQGTGDALFAVTNSAAAASGAVDVRWIETIMPVATNGDAQWAAWHTDASSTAYYIRKMIVANGDSFDGLRVFGLDHLNGVTIHPWIGGLDLGNFVVSGGRIDLPYTTAFTEAFIQGLSDGTDYGDGKWGLKLRWFDTAIVDEPQYPLNTISVIGSDTGDHTIYEPRESTFHWDRGNEVAYELDLTGRSVRVYDAFDGTLLRSAQGKFFFGDEDFSDVLYSRTFSLWSSSWVLSASGAFLFGPTRTISNPPYGLFNALTLKPGSVNVGSLNSPSEVSQGVISNPGTSSIPFSVMCGGKDLAVYFCQGSGAHAADRFVIFNLNSISFGQNGVVGAAALSEYAIAFDKIWDGRLITPLAGLPYNTPVEHSLAGCRGFEVEGGSAVFYVWGRSTDQGNPYDTQFRLYKVSTETNADPTTDAFVNVNYELVKTLNISDFDANWTEMRMNFTPDLYHGGLVGMAFRGPSDTLGEKMRVFRLSPTTYDILWQMTPNIDTVPLAQAFHPMERLTGGFAAFMRNQTGGNHDNEIIIVDLLDGSEHAHITGQVQTLSGFAGQTGKFFFDAEGPSFVFWGQFNAASYLINYTPLGDFATDHYPTWSSRWNRLWIGNAFPQDQEHRAIDAEYLFIPTNFGVSFTSRGQLLPPDYGQDGGARAGPGFGKIRRTHWWAVKFVDSYNVSIGTDFDKLNPVSFVTRQTGVAVSTPARFTGTLSDTLRDDFTFDGALAWEITRQYPTTITVVAGYIETNDK